jgi:hypothetical protein
MAENIEIPKPEEGAAQPVEKPEAQKGMLASMGEDMQKRIYQKAFRDLLDSKKLRIREEKPNYIVLDVMWDVRKGNEAYGTFILGGEYLALFREEFGHAQKTEK